MSGIGVYAAKTALIAALQAAAAVGQPLEGVQVEYAAPGNFGDDCVYGGGVRFDHSDAIAEHPGILVTETASVSLYIRVTLKQPSTVADADARVALIASAILTVLKASPQLGGGISWQAVTGGQGDYGQTDDEAVSILAVQVELGKQVTYG